ncbi:MAG: GFA family protein [Granulosicoccus sp.]|nr:GFA family protein [Granulosicoccus sp.]
MKITGGCHCGKIKYEAEINPDTVLVCHCTDCQVLSGSAFRSVAFSEHDAFTLLTGEPKVYIKTGDSGNKRVQTFCSNCGSPIYTTSVDDGPKQYGIRLGTVEQRNQIAPQRQKWCRSSQNWIQDLCSLPGAETEKQ